jgi:predicted nucleic acid-binding protein
MTALAGSSGRRVLVDSSVWIDFYRPSCSDEIRRRILEALAAESVFTASIIVAEVVQGAPDEDLLEELTRDFSALHTVEVDFDVGASAARIGYALRRRGRPAPSTDLLIAAAAMAAECELWHQDAHFQTIATVTPLQQRRLS